MRNARQMYWKPSALSKKNYLKRDGPPLYKVNTPSNGTTTFKASGLEKITGIHQKQLWAYMHGRSKPRRQQIERIENGIKSFGRELESLAVTE